MAASRRRIEYAAPDHIQDAGLVFPLSGGAFSGRRGDGFELLPASKAWACWASSSARRFVTRTTLSGGGNTGPHFELGIMFFLAAGGVRAGLHKGNPLSRYVTAGGVGT